MHDEGVGSHEAGMKSRGGECAIPLRWSFAPRSSGVGYRVPGHPMKSEVELHSMVLDMTDDEEIEHEPV